MPGVRATATQAARSGVIPRFALRIGSRRRRRGLRLAGLPLLRLNEAPERLLEIVEPGAGRAGDGDRIRRARRGDLREPRVGREEVALAQDHQVRLLVERLAVAPDFLAERLVGGLRIGTVER